jgi:type II secretory pathway pseudopilin PulG
MRGTERGFTFLGLLIVVMIMGAALAATGTLFSHAAQREKERELLFVGHEFRDAIESYYRRTPGVSSAYPKTLEDLLEDKRFPMPVRHLRRIYADPMTGKPDWVAIEAPGGGIMGVRSRSDAQPIKTGNFELADAIFEDAKHYADWQFFYKPQELPAAAETPKTPAPKG